MPNNLWPIKFALYCMGFLIQTFTWTMIYAIPGAKLITTVRSIPTLYESTFGYYFAYVKEYIKAQTLNNFFSNPKDYFHPAEANKLSQYARNTMTHDLGYPEESRDLELRLVFDIKLAFLPVHFRIEFKPIESVRFFVGFLVGPILGPILGRTSTSEKPI